MEMTNSDESKKEIIEPTEKRNTNSIPELRVVITDDAFLQKWKYIINELATEKDSLALKLLIRHFYKAFIMENRTISPLMNLFITNIKPYELRVKLLDADDIKKWSLIKEKLPIPAIDQKLIKDRKTKIQNTEAILTIIDNYSDYLKEFKIPKLLNN